MVYHVATVPPGTYMHPYNYYYYAAPEVVEPVEITSAAQTVPHAWPLSWFEPIGGHETDKWNSLPKFPLNAAKPLINYHQKHCWCLLVTGNLFRYALRFKSEDTGMDGNSDAVK